MHLNFAKIASMSGFKKSTAVSNAPSKVISSGIKTLDELVELSPGSVTCIYEDRNSLIHNMLLQVFYSSFFTENREAYICSTEEKHFVRFDRFVGHSETSKTDPILIAWRYKNLDIANSMQIWEFLNKIEIDKNAQLACLEDLLCKMRTSKSAFFSILSLFSPLYGEHSEDSMTRTFFEIRKLARMNSHTVVLSFPAFLFSQRYSNYFDSILQIVNNLTLPHEKPLYCSYLEILKLSKPGSVAVNNLESYKYGIVLRARKIKIERIDVPPEEVTPKESCAKSF